MKLLNLCAESHLRHGGAHPLVPVLIPLFSFPEPQFQQRTCPLSVCVYHTWATVANERARPMGAVSGTTLGYLIVDMGRGAGVDSDNQSENKHQEEFFGPYTAQGICTGKQPSTWIG